MNTGNKSQSINNNCDFVTKKKKKNHKHFSYHTMLDVNISKYQLYLQLPN